MSIQIRQWRAISNQEISKEAIAAMHQPSSAYRVSEYTYPAGTKFPGLMREGTCYVLSGECRFATAESIWIRAGEFVTLPHGEFQIEVSSSGPATLVLAWALPWH
jgi:hypothetical protein